MPYLQTDLTVVQLFQGAMAHTSSHPEMNCTNNVADIQLNVFF